MSVFQEYAQFYDLLYQDKNYDAEVAYLESLMKKYGNGGKDILELGSGTGKHALLLAQHGYSLHGIDMSASMVEGAQKLKQLYPNLADKLVFDQGDLRTVRINRKFDVIVSLFHVMSYQITDEDLMQGIQTATHHLRPGGIFIFDFWYGPAVMHDKPVVRVKRVENDDYKVMRLTEPAIESENHTVKVNFTVYAQDKETQMIQEFKEAHHMRYFFEDELAMVMRDQGLIPLLFEEWVTGNKPVQSSFGVCAVGKKI